MTNKNKNIAIGVGVVSVTALVLLLSSSKKESGGSSVDPTGNGAITNAGSFSAQKIADELYNLCKTTGAASFLNPGQRDKIFSILKNVSQSQFAEVMKKFGKRAYNRTWNNNYFLVGTTPTYYPLNIILQDELTEEDYATLKSKYPNSL